MKTRIITGACMVAVAIPLLIWSVTPVLSAAIVLLALIGVFEYLRCIGIEKALGFAIPSYLMAAAAPLMARYLNGHWMFFFGVAYVYTFYMLAHAMLTSEKSDFSKVAKAVVGTLYISSGFACLLAARDLEHGLFLLIMIVVTAFGTDIFAYFSGYFFGKHKLIPAVSPKKTVEGALGGLLGSVAVLCAFTRDGQLSIIESVVILLFFAGFMADSLISAKREHGAESNEIVQVDTSGKNILINIGKFLLGAAAIVLGAQLLIDNGTALAQLLHVPDSIIGATMIAIGTSLPELVTTITAIRKKQSDLSVGNIIGANLMDITLIMPLCALLLGKPLTVENQGMLLDIPACLIVSAGALVPALICGRFKRWIGFFIGGLYIVYLVIMFACFGV